MRTAEGRARRIMGRCYPLASQHTSGKAMSCTTEPLADIVIGVARAQNAVIEAMERANPGFRNTHALPLITLAANMRAGDPRMIDLSARILMRLQGRVALDNAQVKADLERLMSGKSAAAAKPTAAGGSDFKPKPRVGSEK